MTPRAWEIVAFDAPMALTATLAALSCALLGNFLVLRRQSLMGDAISHAVLPGIVVAFLLTHGRESFPMFLGALAAGLVAVLLIGAIRRFGRVESGAAMGVAFSVLFALGVLLIEQAAARHVDLDADCVLHGQLETIFWTPPTEWAALWRWETLAPVFGEDGAQIAGVPRQTIALFVTALVVIAFIAAFFKELRLASFDAQLAGALGLRPGWLNAALLALVAVAAVASFEAVGSILVIAMLICPAATARLLTDRMLSQVLVSAMLAIVAGLGGYALGAHGPLWLGYDHSLNAAGTITVVSGALLAVAIVAAPRHGALAKRLRRMRTSVTIAREDLLGVLHRAEERGVAHEVTAPIARRAIGGGAAARFAVRRAKRRNEATVRDGALRLTDRGRGVGAEIVRSHRLWESYLVEQLGLRPDHVHDTATVLEHLRREGRERIAPPREEGRESDPHDKPIP